MPCSCIVQSIVLASPENFRPVKSKSIFSQHSLGKCVPLWKYCSMQSMSELRLLCVSLDKFGCVLVVLVFELTKQEIIYLNHIPPA
jgi:hypothetical protein